jgi:hypothetical protein
MRFLLGPLLALTCTLSALAADPAPAPTAQWECMDRVGAKVVQDHPCGPGMVEWQASAVPGYVWGIVAVLGVIWLFALMPQSTLMRWRAATPPLPALLPVGLPPLTEGPPADAHVPARRAAAAPVRTAAATTAAAAAPAPAPARPATWSHDAIVKLSPRRFEELVQALWQANGYKAVLAGTDLNIHNAATGRLFAIARAAAAGTAVGVGIVQGLWDVVQRQSAGLGVCYGPSGFAIDALGFAAGKRLKLVSGAELLAQIRVLKPEQQKALLEHVWRA